MAYAGTVAVAEFSDGLEVRCQPTGEPHQLDAALGLALQAPAGLDAIQVSADAELEPHFGRVRRPPSDGGVHALEIECLKIQLVDKGAEDARWVVFE